MVIAMKKIVIAKPFYAKNSPTGYRMLVEKGYEIVLNPHNRDYTQDEIIEVVGDIDGIIADSEPWGEQTLSAAPKLKIISRYGVGMDSVDTQACQRHGVMVTNCPGLNSNAVAEQAVALLLSAIRKIPLLNAKTKSGQWPKELFKEIDSHTVGILGFGGIGQKVAKKLGGFDCRIVAYDKFPDEGAARSLNVELLSFDQLLKQSDFISVHMPLLPETKHCINAETIAKMQDGVIIVNTSRGPIVDEAAMAQVVKSGKVLTFATDVFEQEPPRKDLSLFELEGCICTPHSAANTYENEERTGIATAQVLIDVFEGREPPNRRV